ncbi:unnamed protein product, partial [Brenthis ino]
MVLIGSRMPTRSAVVRFVQRDCAGACVGTLKTLSAEGMSLQSRDLDERRRSPAARCYLKSVRATIANTGAGQHGELFKHIQPLLAFLQSLTYQFPIVICNLQFRNWNETKGMRDKVNIPVWFKEGGGRGGMPSRARASDSTQT